MNSGQGFAMRVLNNVNARRFAALTDLVARLGMSESPMSSIWLLPPFFLLLRLLGLCVCLCVDAFTAVAKYSSDCSAGEGNALRVPSVYCPRNARMFSCVAPCLSSESEHSPAVGVWSGLKQCLRFPALLPLNLKIGLDRAPQKFSSSTTQTHRH